MRKTLKQLGVVFALTSVLLMGTVPSASAGGKDLPPDVVLCHQYSFLDLTADAVVENPTVLMYDDKGILLNTNVAVGAFVNARLEVCVAVSAAANVEILLEAVLDGNGDGKKDTIAVGVGVVAAADATVVLSAKIRAQVGLQARVAAQVNAQLAIKGGEKKEYSCKGKDGVDSY